MQRLQVEPIDRLRRDELHYRPLHGFGDCPDARWPGARVPTGNLIRLASAANRAMFVPDDRFSQIAGMRAD
jgi:hypothetical protein